MNIHVQVQVEMYRLLSDPQIASKKSRALFTSKVAKISIKSAYENNREIETRAATFQPPFYPNRRNERG